MRRNIAKVSALIMAATTTMSPMMPVATTVVRADEVVTLADSKATAGTVDADSIDFVVDWDKTTAVAKYSLTNGVVMPEETAEVFKYVDAVCGGKVRGVIFRVKIEDKWYYSNELAIPEGKPGYQKIEHDFATKTVVTKLATCTETGIQETRKYCTHDGCTFGEQKVEGSEVTLPALGHDFVEQAFDATYAENNYYENILLKADNKSFELDANGKPQAKDKTKTAVYAVKSVCSRDDEEEVTFKTIAPTTVSEEDSVVIAASDTALITAHADKNLPKIENTRKTTDGKVELVDCTKNGTYLVLNYNGDGVYLGYEVKTIEAHHTWGKFELVKEDKSYDADTKALIEETKIVVTYDKEGNPVVKNLDCYRTATVKLNQKCTNASEKTPAVNEDSVMTVTVEPTGDHQYGNTIKYGNYTAAEDGSGHWAYAYKECAACGYKDYLDETKYPADVVKHFVKHDKTNTVNNKTRKENIVEATCGTEGSYDLVTYCKDCGYEFDTEHVIVAATGKHEKWSDVEVEWVGDKVIAGSDTITAKLHQYCQECGTDHYEKVEVALHGEKAVTDTENKAATFSVKGVKVIESKYECTPDQVVIQAVYTQNNKKTVLDEITVPYYEDKEAYYHRGQHVAGKVEDVTEDGKTYKVTYCSICGEEISREEIETPEPEKTLGQVEGLKATAKADGQVEVSWDALEGADGYLVVAINGKVRGQQIGYTAGTSFVDKDANAKDYNYYWVIPYFKNADGKIVKGQLTGYVYAMKQTEFAAVAESTEDGVALTWEAVEGASKYIVKAKAASEKTATAIATVEGTEYVDATASADEYTFYWVFPVYTNAAGKDVVGNASNYVFGMTK